VWKRLINSHKKKIARRKVLADDYDQFDSKVDLEQRSKDYNTG